MNKKYLSLLAKEFSTIDSAVSEIVNLSFGYTQSAKGKKVILR